MLEFRNFLGRGGHSEVYECLYDENLNACKIIESNKEINLLELFLMKLLPVNSCFNLAKKIFFEKNKIYIIQEKYDRVKSKRKTLNLEKIVDELIESIFLLHSMNIIHGDIKIDNLLLDKNDKLKLCDYSSSCLLINKYRKIIMGTQTHIPYEKNWNEKIDIWSLGCTIFELKYGYSLFPQQETNNSVKSLLEKHTNALIDWYKITKQEDHEKVKYIPINYNKINLPKDFLSSTDKLDLLIKKCLVIDQYKRPSINELYNKKIENKDFICRINESIKDEELRKFIIKLFTQNKKPCINLNTMNKSTKYKIINFFN